MPLISNLYSDIDLNFMKHPVTGDIMKKKDVAAISASLYNIFNTSRYERPFNPDLGGNLRQALFEPVDSSSAVLIKDLITIAIQNFEPRVELVDLNIEPNIDENGYKVFLTFFVTNIPDPITINLFLERVR